MGPESHIESAVCKWARENGITPVKLSSPNARGQADRMFMRHGRVCFVEMKAPGNVPTALQEKWLLDRRNDGFAAVWGSNKDEIIKWLKHQLLNKDE